jgi:hypothetical protein
MTRNRTTMPVGNIEGTLITAKERRKINQSIKNRYNWLRKRYPEVRGKRVDWIEHRFEQDWLYVGIRFVDGTYFSLQFSPHIETEGVEYSDMSSGDDLILREYYRRKER